MKRRDWQISLVLVGLLLLPLSEVQALPQGGDFLKIFNGPGTTGGGEFNIDLKNNGIGTDYISFCLERSEYISFDTEYEIDHIVDYAELGGGGAVDGKDYISDATKWLYHNYMFGDYVWSRTTGVTAEKANAVQNTIWFLEDEFTDTGWANLSISKQSSYDLYNIVQGQGDYSFNGVVKVINLVDASGNRKQSQLIGEPVPEPSTMLLMGAGIAGLAVYARKRKKK
ncbi:PEP-CTERM sorting domain-containing protein [Desulfosediminicola flagellatus]|uniref:PEP-CTERM sorting domain-containing protein n=1 Tax=Desulfosediminicola flagellatus TaxID=2569541 RepID=UPI0010ACBB9A|nr:PEP-CTERM sorting domain-containing protein [Desulfosediminicola flagellatus]